MKEFFKIMEMDFLKEKFTKRELVIYGVVAPLVLVAGILIESWIAHF